jgi:hypothetical protein
VLSACVFVLALSVRANAQTTAGGWLVAGVGQPSSAGSAAFGPDILTLTSTGGDVAGFSDQFTFAYRAIAGNATIIARLDAVQALSASAQAGLMIRESLVPTARHAFVFANGSRGAAFRSRTVADRSTLESGASPAGDSAWLKLERVASELIASRSRDGVTWTVVATSTIDLPDTVLVGGAVAGPPPPTKVAAEFGVVGRVGHRPRDRCEFR